MFSISSVRSSRTRSSVFSASNLVAKRPIYMPFFALSRLGYGLLFPAVRTEKSILRDALFAFQTFHYKCSCMEVKSGSRTQGFQEIETTPQFALTGTYRPTHSPEIVRFRGFLPGGLPGALTPNVRDKAYAQASTPSNCSKSFRSCVSSRS